MTHKIQDFSQKHRKDYQALLPACLTLLWGLASSLWVRPHLWYLSTLPYCRWALCCCQPSDMLLCPELAPHCKGEVPALEGPQYWAFSLEPEGAPCFFWMLAGSSLLIVLRSFHGGWHIALVCWPRCHYFLSLIINALLHTIPFQCAHLLFLVA